MSYPELYKLQHSELPLLSTTETCAGKTYIVTGSNTGIGFEAAKHLIELRSHRVIMAVRNIKSGEAALKTIEADTGVRGVGQVWYLDLASYDSVLKFADRVTGELDRVDGVIQNATAAPKDWITLEGWESCLTVNLFSTVLLMILIMPHLSACAAKYGTKPVVDIVGTTMAFDRKVDVDRFDLSNGIFKDLNDPKKWAAGANRYSLSKLLQVFVVRELGVMAPVERTGVVINTVNPGLCKTSLTRNADMVTKAIMGIFKALMGRPAEWGSRNMLHAIEAGEESHGKFLSYCAIREEWIPDWVSNENGRSLGKQIWEEVEEELEKVKPGCVSRALRQS